MTIRRKLDTYIGIAVVVAAAVVVAVEAVPAIAEVPATATAATASAAVGLPDEGAGAAGVLADAVTVGTATATTLGVTRADASGFTPA